jgi:hypothetical protein
MKAFYPSSIAVAASIGLASSSPMLRARAAQLELVHQFPNFTWIENMVCGITKNCVSIYNLIRYKLFDPTEKS